MLFSKPLHRQTRRHSIQNKKRARLMEQLEQRLMLASDWTNPARPNDINNDMRVSALDALIVINALNQAGGPSDLGQRTNRLGLYLDPTGDSRVSAVDAINVINQLNGAGNASSIDTSRIEG